MARRRTPEVESGNGDLRPFRRFSVIGGAAMVFVALGTTTLAIGSFFFAQAQSKIARPIMESIALQDSLTKLDRTRIKAQIALAARAINESNAVKRSMLVERIEELNK